MFVTVIVTAAIMGVIAIAAVTVPRRASSPVASTAGVELPSSTTA